MQAPCLPKALSLTKAWVFLTGRKWQPQWVGQARSPGHDPSWLVHWKKLHQCCLLPKQAVPETAACGSGQLWGMRFTWANNPVGSTWGCEALEDMQG